MRKLFLMLALVFIGGYASAQVVLTANVPKEVREKFDAMYPSASMVMWEKEGGNYEADFKMESKSYSAVFEPSGTFVQKEESIEEASLPTGAKEYLGKNYPGKKLVECVKITKADGKIMYEAEVEATETEFTFDESGNYVSQKKEKGIVK
jgi:uncharacterized membrane protein YkoI